MSESKGEMRASHVRDDPADLGVVEIAFLDWLARLPTRRGLLHQHGLGDSSGEWSFLESEEDGGPLHRLRDESEVAAITHVLGRRTPEMGRLLRLGFTGRPNQASSRQRLGHDPFRYSLYVVTRTGHAWWVAEGKARYDAVRQKADAVRAEATRTVAIGSWLSVKAEMPHGYSAPDRRIMFATHLATVTKETQKRVYVTDVRKLFDPPTYFRPPFEGRAPSVHVDLSFVMFDHVTPGIARRIAEAERGHWDDVVRIQAQYVDQIRDAMKLLEDRMLQKAAEREQTLAELLDGDARVAPKGP